ncbi:unnamed protein product [Nyctereutes procyonoides]|uniref:(raccoon dog) hypothetical protein n=1 Tax=Nyctereutes procyonoides TaxID=34880 RepID=A0A811YK31_NYCPR|nr:unnamed protein product [Nyctereutes procyonoides]
MVLLPFHCRITENYSLVTFLYDGEVGSAGQRAAARRPGGKAARGPLPWASSREEQERVCFCACTEHTCSETLSLTKAGICASQCCSPESLRPTWPCSDGGAWHQPPLGARGHVTLHS